MTTATRGMMTRRILGAGALAFVFAGSVVLAQAPQTVRIRGTIEKIDGQVLEVKSRDGSAMTVKLAANVQVSEVVKASMSDVKEGAYIAVTGMPQADGTQKALTIFIFPAGVHPPDGFRPWDFSANSTMTNATVTSTVASTNGNTLTVKYTDGEKTVTVGADTVIATAKKAAISDLKAGQKVSVFAAKKLEDGTFEAPAVAFGDYGVWR